MRTASPLQRGKACLCCRKRKMKCDGSRPACSQCEKAGRGSECRYHDKKQVSRTEMLRAKQAKLEARLLELESGLSESSSGGTPVALSPESSSSGSQSEMNAFYPSNDLPLDSSSSAVFGLDWDESTFSVGPGSADSPYQVASSSLAPSDSWLSECPELFLEDVYVGKGKGIAGLANPQMGVSPFSNWWEDQDTFCRNKQKLLDIFLEHRHQCAFDVHIGRFRASLALPPAQRPHPALLDAMYLIACYHSQVPELAILESHFLQKSLSGIFSSLQHSDRLIQVVQASCLLAVYFFSRGRVIEGYYHSSTAARLAVSLGLHQIKSEGWYHLRLDVMAQPVSFLSFKSSLRLTAPNDATEYAERVAAFWQVFVVDRAWSVACGLPAALPDDDSPRAQIETTLPSAIGNSPNPTESFHGLQYLNANKLNPSLRAKVTTLFERTYRLSSMTFQSDELFWTQHRSLDMSLQQFEANLPPVAAPLYYDHLEPSDADSMSIRIMMHTSTIHLHRDFLEVNTTSYERCFVAANSMTSITRELNDGDYDYLNPIVSTCWKVAAQVYMQILRITQPDLFQSVLGALEQDLVTLINAMKCLGKIFPAAVSDATKTELALSIARTSFYV